LKIQSNFLSRIINGVSIAIFLFLVTAFLLDTLGDAPIRALQLWSGRIACFFLLASLTIPPLRLLTGISIIIPLRKTFGLNAFYYALLHLLVFLILNYRLHWAAIAEAFTQLNFILPGAIAFFILLVLAVTTINPVKRAVKKIWRRIHMWVYPANVLVLLHYTWITNGSFPPQGKPKVLPILLAGYLAMLFILRLQKVKISIIRWRQRR
jgi:sulfoxide reductase heme-binding subunit YedZ